MFPIVRVSSLVLHPVLLGSTVPDQSENLLRTLLRIADFVSIAFSDRDSRLHPARVHTSLVGTKATSYGMHE